MRTFGGHERSRTNDKRKAKKKKIQENTEHLQNKLNMARKGTKYVCLILAETAEQKTDVQLICIST